MPVCRECGYEMTEVDVGVYECHIPWCSRYMEGFQMTEKFEISAVVGGMFLTLKYHPGPYYEGEDSVEHSMVIFEGDIDDLMDVLSRYIEKRGGN